MKKSFILFLIVFFLVSCDLDTTIEAQGGVDRDDINIIEKIGKQGLDKAMDLYNTKSSAS